MEITHHKNRSIETLKKARVEVMDSLIDNEKYPLVSVVMCAYNAERFIKATIDSILNQTYSNIELVIVNDGSEDSSADIILSYPDTRIRYYSLPVNGHICAARNEALRHAKGEYIAIADADDIWMPEKIEKQIGYLQKHTDCGACFTWADIIDENDNVINEKEAWFYNTFSQQNRSRGEWLMRLLKEGNCFCNPSSFFKKEVLDNIGELNLSLLQLQDFDYWIRVLKKYEIYVIPEKLTGYRRVQNDNKSISAVTETTRIRTQNESVSIFCRFFEGLSETEFTALFSRYFRNSESSTEEELLCEKAFILKSAYCGLEPYYRALQALINEKAAGKILKTTFGINQMDFYKLNAERRYLTQDYAEEHKKLQSDNARLKADITAVKEAGLAERAKYRQELDAERKITADLTNENDGLNAKLLEKEEKLSFALEYIKQLENSNQTMNNELYRIHTSRTWKMAEKLRKIIRHFIPAGKKRKVSPFFYLHTFAYRLLGNTLPYAMLRNAKNNGIKSTGNFLKLWIKKKKCAREWRRNKQYSITPESFGSNSDEYLEKTEEQFEKNILFSIIVPLYNTPEVFLEQMIDSVRIQTYPGWELCLADGSGEEYGYIREYCENLAAEDSRIKYKRLKKNLGISGNTNACLEMATGEYIALLDHDDLLNPYALTENMSVICDDNADFIFSDEKVFTKNLTEMNHAHFKPDYAPDTLRSYNYICHLTVFRRGLLDKAGAFRNGFDGSQDFDLFLRLTEKAEKIVHIPKILYYWRASESSTALNAGAKNYALDAGKKAVAEQLKREGINGTVTDSSIPTTYRVKYEIKGSPLISILIPTCDHPETLKKCLDSIMKLSTWNNYEIVLIENNSKNKKTFEYYDSIKDNSRIRIVTWKGEFNYSAINNYGFKYCTGDYLILLNNDTEIITPDWIQEMLMFAQRPDVGAVGAMLYYPSDKVQHAGVILGLGGVAGHSHKGFSRGEYGFMSRLTIAQNLSAVTAACMMLPRGVYEELGGLDEGFKVAFNDVDLCMRIRKSGRLIVWTPYAELYHYESESRGYEDTPEKQARFESEVQKFKLRWKAELEKGDPYYNPNLTLDREDFSLKQ